MARYDDAVSELYRAPHAAFVTERKRLAAELKAGGDKEGAARLAKLPRPPVSAWAVNQLWWRAREAFEAMLATAATVRGGDLAATGPHREAAARLRARAAELLEADGHAASEATLRRVTTTLAAIAATGSWEPDPPGALAEDRDPPGFETMGIGAIAAGPVAAAPRAAQAPRQQGAAAATDEPELDEALAAEAAVTEAEEAARDAAAAKAATAAEAAAREAEARRRREQEEAVRRAEAAAERRRREQEAARRRAERQRLEAALRTATGEVHRLERDADRLRRAVTEAEERLARAKEIAADLEAKLGELGGDGDGDDGGGAR